VKAGSKFRLKFTVVFLSNGVTYEEVIHSNVFVMNNCNKNAELRGILDTIFHYLEKNLIITTAATEKGPPNVMDIKNSFGLSTQQTEVWIKGTSFGDNGIPLPFTVASNF
jgi:hypothetical protein